MSGISNSIAAMVTQSLFGGDSYSPPTTYWLGLSSDFPDDDGTGVVEPTGPSYGRVELTNNATTFQPIDSRRVANDIEIAFAEAEEAWGAIPWFVLYDDETGGNFCAFGDIDDGDGVTIAIGDTLTFPVGDLVIRIPGAV